MSGLLAHAGLLLNTAPPVAGAVSFISATGANYVASGTTISSPTTPAGILNGDGLFALVFARSALTPPAGWTLVASRANTGTLTQTLYIYQKNSVTTGDSSTAFTWTQATSGRMGLAYITARSTSGSIVIAQVGDSETDYSVSTPYPQNVTISTLTATVNGELFLIAASAESASGSTNTWTAPTGATARTTAVQNDSRLIGFTQARDNGQSNASPATLSAGASTANFYTNITVRLQP